MADKSPHGTHTKKTGKTVKQKRVERKAKAETTAAMERLMHPKKRAS